MNRLFGVIPITLLLFTASFSFAQINQTDDKGRKQGVWKKNHPNGKLRYKGQFIDDVPVGVFSYYTEEGKLAVENAFYEGGDRAYSTAYDAQGKVMARGVYQDQKKDSTWNYYMDTVRISTEIYDRGVKTGTWKTWYPTGTLAEEITYVNDQPEGKYLHYYESGKLMIETTYLQGEIDGAYTQYYPTGEKQVEGQYRASLKQGTWTSYLKDGKIEFVETYNENGSRISQQRMNGLQVEYYDNDIPKSEINYQHGKKNGEFREYYEAGEWKVRVHEVEGQEPVEENYLEGQKLKVSGKYFNDQYHGKITWYDQEGKVIKSEMYRYGKKVES